MHPGGPFWAKKDLGAWSIPKGEHDEGEDGAGVRDPRVRRRRPAPRRRPGELDDLGTVKQKAGKVVQAWALEGDLDARRDPLEHVHDAVAAALGRRCRSSPRSTGRSGSRSMKRVSASTPRRRRFSTGCMSRFDS